jgi:transposase
MKYYTTTTRYNCGIDLHARQMYVCLMNKDGKILVHRNVRRNDFDYFLKIVDPYRHDLTVCCECTFNWYWLADACHEAGITFVLGHALYMKAVHGGKTKNDRIDSEKIAHLLRSNLIPPGYVYPAEKRPLRMLLRRRTYFVWKRSELLAQMTVGAMTEGIEFSGISQHRRQAWKEALIAAHSNELHREAVEANMYMVQHYDRVIDKLERVILSHTRRDHSWQYNLLKTVPGIGKVIALTILYETDDISRFPRVQDFSSYCRLVKGTVASAGIIKGTRGGKLGNAYLKWAFSQAAILGKRSHPKLRKFAQRLEAKHKKPVANAILASKIGRAVYFMLRDQKPFDVNKVTGDKN